MKKILPGQLVMPRIDFSKKDYMVDSIKLVKDFNVSGFIVFNGDIEQVKGAISELQSRSREKLFFACDAERGLGQIVDEGTTFPFLMSQGAANDRELVREQARITASELKDCGFNMVFAPVLDVNSNPENPIINIRAFGDDPELVTDLGTEYITSVQESGIIACAKHFPGHGGCDIDSHVTLPVVNRSEEQLVSQDMIPFREAVNKGLASLMLAHVSYTAFDKDSIPATFSPYIINKILRQDIGFEGVLISDSFMMGALREFGTESEIALRSLNAGCNLILDPVDPFSLIDYLGMQYNKDKNFANIVNEHTDLISRFKNRYLTGKHVSAIFAADQAGKTVDRICDSSVCRLKGGVLQADKVELLIVDIAQVGETVADSFSAELLRNGIYIESVRYITDTEGPYRLTETRHSLPLIVVIYTSVRAWKEYSTVPDSLGKMLNEYIKTKEQTALLSFGSPYVIRCFDHSDIVLVAFDSLPSCQSAMARALLGKTDIKGILPVELQD